MLNFKCNSSTLLKAVTIVEKSIPTRSSAQILENLSLSLKGQVLTLWGYDMEIGIEYRLPIDNVTATGDVLVKAKTLVSILAKLASQDVEISVDDTYKMHIKGDHVEFEILCLAPAEYPKLPPIETGQSLRLRSGDVCSLIQHTLFSVSTDESRKFLNGILMKVSGEDVVFVSTDGYRLSLKSQKIETALPETAVIIPTKAVSEMLRIAQQAEPDQMVEIAFSERQVAFFMPSFLLVSRVLEGKFPDYKQLMPTTFENEFTLARRPFLEACERAYIVSSFSHNVVRVVLTDNRATIQANASSFGDFQEDLAITKLKGVDELKIAFNVKLVIDALKNTESDDVHLRINHGTSPCLIEPASGGDYTYVVMPIRTNDYQAPTAEAITPASAPEPQSETPSAQVENTDSFAMNPAYADQH